MTYFNTTNESGATLKNNVAKAKSQELNLYNLIKRYDYLVSLAEVDKQFEKVWNVDSLKEVRRLLKEHKSYLITKN